MTERAFLNVLNAFLLFYINLRGLLSNPKYFANLYAVSVYVKQNNLYISQ